MRAHVYWLFLLAASNAACLRQTAFHCASDGECSGGTCEVAVGYCSGPDSACASGQRFGDSAGPYAGQCVGGQQPDGGVDTMIDAMIDGPPSGCPAGYMNLGAQAHMYKLISTTADWGTQQTACAATKPGGAAYLAIPDDATELGDLDTLAGMFQIWVGISDQQTNNVYLTVKGTTQTYLPWAPGQPAPEPPPQDCVKALINIAEFGTEKCNASIKAICECEP